MKVLNSNIMCKYGRCKTEKKEECRKKKKQADKHKSLYRLDRPKFASDQII